MSTACRARWRSRPVRPPANPTGWRRRPSARACPRRPGAQAWLASRAARSRPAAGPGSATSFDTAGAKRTGLRRCWAQYSGSQRLLVAEPVAGDGGQDANPGRLQGDGLQTLAHRRDGRLHHRRMESVRCHQTAGGDAGGPQLCFRVSRPRAACAAATRRSRPSPVPSAHGRDPQFAHPVADPVTVHRERRPRHDPVHGLVIGLGRGQAGGRDHVEPEPASSLPEAGRASPAPLRRTRSRSTRRAGRYIGQRGRGRPERATSAVGRPASSSSSACSGAPAGPVPAAGARTVSMPWAPGRRTRPAGRPCRRPG